MRVHVEMRAVGRWAVLTGLVVGLALFVGPGRLRLFTALPLQQIPGWLVLLLVVSGSLLGAAAASARVRRATPGVGGHAAGIGGDPSLVLRAVLDTSPHAAIGIDRRDRVTMWSPAATALLGWTPAEVIGRPLPLVAESEDGRARTLAQAMRGDRTPGGTRLRIRRKDGTALPARLRATQVNGGARASGFVLAIEDLSGAPTTVSHAEHAAREPGWAPAEAGPAGAATAEETGASAERLRQLEDARHRVDLLERARALDSTLTHVASGADVARTAGEGALRLTGADRAAVYLRQPDGTLSCPWSRNLSESYVGQVLHHAKLLAGGRMMDGAKPDILELSGRGLDGAAPVLYGDVRALAPAVAVPRLTQAEGYRALGTWPLVYERQALGLLSCYYDAPHTWSPAEEDVFHTFAATVGFALHNGYLHDDQVQRAADLEILFDLSRRLRVARNLEEIYPILVDHAAGLLNADSAAVLLVAAGGSEFSCVYAIGALSEVRGTSFPIPGSPLARVAHEGQDHRAMNLGGEPLPVWMNGFRGIGPAVAVPLRSEREMIGVFCLGRKRRSDAAPFTDAEVRTLDGLAEIGGNAIRRARLFQNLENAYIQMVVSLARTMDARDSYTSGHSERISEWAEAIGRELGCAAEEVQDIRWGALLHDIGKIGIPDAILRKPGKLTDAEWAIMRKHPEIGEEILGSTERMRGVAALVRHHQEKWNGTGYPDKLSGEEIPLGARILAVCDAYSAITDDRPYKRARTHDQALEELHRCEGSHFDPRVVAAFCQVVERHRERAKLSRVR